MARRAKTKTRTSIRRRVQSRAGLDVKTILTIALTGVAIRQAGNLVDKYIFPLTGIVKEGLQAGVGFVGGMIAKNSLIANSAIAISAGNIINSFVDPMITDNPQIVQTTEIITPVPPAVQNVRALAPEKSLMGYDYIAPGIRPGLNGYENSPRFNKNYKAGY